MNTSLGAQPLRTAPAPQPVTYVRPPKHGVTHEGCEVSCSGIRGGGGRGAARSAQRPGRRGVYRVGRRLGAS